MTRAIRTGLAVWLIAACARPAGAAGGKSPDLPPPEMVVSRTARPPAIDGRIEPGEWDRAAACTAFVQSYDGALAHLQTIAQLTYDDRFLYVCFKNLRGAPHGLIAVPGRRPDEDAIVLDYANEVWLSPPATPACAYQSVFNTYPAVFDCRRVPAAGLIAKSWGGDWQVASSQTNDSWIIEARAPIASFGVTRIEDGAVWRALFATDMQSDPDRLRAWAPVNGFDDVSRHGLLRFNDASPIVQVWNIESLFSGRFAFPVAVTAPPGGRSTVTVSARFGSGVSPADGDVTVSQTVTVDKGRREFVTLSGDVSRIRLPGRASGAGARKPDTPGGFCEILAKTETGAVLYRQIFPYAVDGYVRAPPAVIRDSPYVTPFGLTAVYAPLSRTLMVGIDRYYMKERTRAVAGRARLFDLASGRMLAERTIAPFTVDFSRFPMDLAQVPVPVQTETDWEKVRAAMAQNEAISAKNRKRVDAGKAPWPPVDMPGQRPLDRALEVSLTDSAGREVARVVTNVPLSGYEFQWLPNAVGISDKVIPPWTAVQVNGDAVSMWNRTYRLNGLGLAEEIVNAGRPQLSGPMQLDALLDGKQVRIRAGAPAVKKVTEAAAEFTGTARLGDLEFAVETRVEFDGFVLNTMTLRPAGPVRLDGLSLVITAPKSEAECFVTSAGPGASRCGWTPAHWDSREMSSATRAGNFAPYLFITDSDRGFCWFADSDHGWRLDPAAPTQELVTDADTVTLRVRFVTRPGIVTNATTIVYGWMATPQKPQPAGWRGYLIANKRPYPQATPVFWSDADWAVLRPFWSSPYPWDYGRSKALIGQSLSDGVLPFVGAVAPSIARYRDATGREFPALAGDWGAIPGDATDGNVARSRGPNDFQLWHYDQWAKKSGLCGLYLDGNSLGEDVNYLTGHAYLLPDEAIQSAYSYLGLREYNKRLRYMFHDNGKPLPNLWLATTGGQAVHAWMPDVSMEADNVHPTGFDFDYPEALPAGRLRSIGMGRNLGSAPFVMCQAAHHWNGETGAFLVPQFVGWVLLHDCLPEGVSFWETLGGEMELWHDDTRFLPYWRKSPGLSSSQDDMLVSAHVGEGRATLWVFNTARDDRQAVITLDLKALGLQGAVTIAFDAETGDRIPLESGTLRVQVPKRFWRAVRLMQPRLLQGNETFVAHFDTEAGADEAFGNRYPAGVGVRPASVEGRTGKAVALDADPVQGLAFQTRHHLDAERGSIVCHLKGALAGASGALLVFGEREYEIKLNRGRLSLFTDKGRKLAEAPVRDNRAAGWQECRISWTSREISLALAGREILRAALPRPLPLAMARGLDIADGRRSIKPATVTFGPLAGIVMDDLTMSR